MIIQRPLFQPESPWKPPRVGSLPSWKGAKRVGIDVECHDPLIKKLGPGVRRGGYVVGYSFAIEDGPSFYVPIRHAGGDNVPDPQQALAYLRDNAREFTGDVCGAGMQYDLDYLAELDITFPNAHRFRDTQVAEALIDELQDRYSLEAIAQRRGLPGKDETLLREAAKAWGVHPKEGISTLPGRFIGPYGEQDSRLPLQLLRRQERDIEEQELDEVWDLECRLLPVLVKMRRRGVKVNFQKLENIEVWSEQQERECLGKIQHETGVRIAVGDVWKPGALQPALAAIGIEVKKTVRKDGKEGQYSIDNNLLDSIEHPVAKLIQRARKVNKLRTTFANSIREHAVKGRIHCTFNQTRRTDDETGDDQGGRYGRLSCVDPNLQQQPSRDDFADMWRSIYEPDDPSCLWASPDLSQQEPRWLVNFAELSRCPGAKAAGEKYRLDPNADNHTMMARLIYGYADDVMPDKKHRTYAKIIFLGLCYGMGGAKLARKLGLPTAWIFSRKYKKMIEIAGPEAQSILDQFNQRAPFVKKLAEKCEEKAKSRGYIKTISGRRCRFPMKKDGSGYDWSHKALNRLIQGSSADQVKMIMVEADAAGFPLQLQVHDELGLTVPGWERANELGHLMRTCVKATVPFKVDVECGPSWGEVKATA